MAGDGTAMGEPDVENIRAGLGLDDGENRSLGEAAAAYHAGYEDGIEGMVMNGLDVGMMEFTMRRYGINGQEMARVLQMPDRTFARRRKERRLRPDESDRLARLGRLLGHALGVLGDADVVREWIHRPNRALGGRKPLLMLETDLGSRRVESVLGRIEHGVIS